MKPDLLELYGLMFKSRLFEEEIRRLWDEGKISGEMHLAIGEEAIAAGIIPQIKDGDALALDHRGTPPLIMRGVDPVLLLREFLGHPEGLCNGMGGHMHLFSSEHLAISSGIVGASGPAALGFAISAQYLRPGNIAVAFFGEGAINQGMMMESFNMSVSWNLPVIFVCKDNQWAITTESSSVTSGVLIDRAKSFGMEGHEIDGSDVKEVWETARSAIGRARENAGPSFLHMHCMRPEGHFLGDPLIRISRHPIKEMKKIAGPLMKSVFKIRGASISERSESIGSVTSSLGKTMKNQVFKKKDPVIKLREELKSEEGRLLQLENNIREEIKSSVFEAIQ